MWDGANRLAALSCTAVGGGVAGHEADDAAHQGGGYVGTGGEKVAGAEEHGVFKCEGCQGGIAAAEPGGECEPQVGRFNEPGRCQPAEQPHEQAAAKVDEQGVPGHIGGAYLPAGADVVAGQVTQHAACKAAAADAEQGLERKNHGE